MVHHSMYTFTIYARYYIIDNIYVLYVLCVYVHKTIWNVYRRHNKYHSIDCQYNKRYDVTRQSKSIAKVAREIRCIVTPTTFRVRQFVFVYRQSNRRIIIKTHTEKNYIYRGVPAQSILFYILYEWVIRKRNASSRWIQGKIFDFFSPRSTN